MDEELNEKMRERMWRKKVELLERGLITPAELVQSCFNELTLSSTPWNEKAVLDFCSRLPGVAQENMHAMLDDLETSGYRWKPFFIGPNENYVPPPDIPERLRAIHKIIQGEKYQKVSDETQGTRKDERK